MYWVAEDELFIWVVAPDGRVRAQRVDVLESRLRSSTRATRPFDDTKASMAVKTVATRGGAQFAPGAPRSNAWRDLYDVLIRPVRAALPAPSITIVPHGTLANLPFAAFQNERGRSLLEDFVLHYAPAGA